ncbi:hypothetical protein KAR91_39595 [Candidatus Pacearchaeota archaeon]|nr:hypothetical protein [Candidatus Pacearchaeota archaeon]
MMVISKDRVDSIGEVRALIEVALGLLKVGQALIIKKGNGYWDVQVVGE